MNTPMYVHAGLVWITISTMVFLLSDSKVLTIIMCSAILIHSGVTSEQPDHVTLVSSVKERQAVCPGKEITLTCSIQNTDVLVWSWGDHIDNRTILHLATATSDSVENQGFVAKLTKVQYNDDRTANFVSSLTLVAFNRLNGTTVNCSSLNYNASYIIRILHVVTLPPPPTIIHHELAAVYSNYSVYVVEWAAVLEAESYEVNVTRADMNGGFSSETTSTSKQVLSFIISSTDININFSIRATNCFGDGEAYMHNVILDVDHSHLENATGTNCPELRGSISNTRDLESVIGVLVSVIGILGGIMVTFAVFMIVRIQRKKECTHKTIKPANTEIASTNQQIPTETENSSETCSNENYINTELCYDDAASARPRPVVNTARTHTTEPTTVSESTTGSSGNTSTNAQDAPTVPAIQHGGDIDEQSDSTATTAAGHGAIPVYDYAKFQSQGLQPSEGESVTTLKEKIKLQPNTSYRVVGIK